MKRMRVEELLQRRKPESGSRTVATVSDIIEKVRKEGDRALRRFTEKFDSVVVDSFRVDLESCPEIDSRAEEAIRTAADRIRRFAERQMSSFTDFEFEIEEGVFSGQRIVPLRSVGAYVPGGRHALVSTVLMCVIPAKIAGVGRIALCSPPGKNGEIDSMILRAAKIAGADEVYRAGGAQAIAALAYGTESVKSVDKIVGPGSRWVSCAKRLVSGDVGIDFIAGPTEVLIVADDSANPAWVAADLAAQAEHDPDAEAILLCESESFAMDVSAELVRILAEGRAGAAAAESLERNSGFVLVSSIEEAAAAADAKAPEHLEIVTKNAEADSRLFSNYGSIFIGPYAAEVFGDYSAGINHTLPTSGSARFSGGLSVKDFLSIRTSLRVDGKRESLTSVAEALADMEGLIGHGNAARARRE